MELKYKLMYAFVIRWIFISGLSMAICIFGQSQEIISKGVPYIQHFENKMDKIYSHIWSIDEAPNHIMYFVSEKGLMEYDGENWFVYKGSIGITRSLKVVSNDLIYNGSDNDFGVWNKDDKGAFVYKSLFKKKPNKTVEEFWNTFALKNSIVFQSFQNLYVYEDNSFTKIQAPKRFVSGFATSNRIYVVDERDGLLSYDGNSLLKETVPAQIMVSDLIGLDEQTNQRIYITKNNGIYIQDLRTQSLKHISKDELALHDEIFTYKRLNSKYLAVGTIQNGVVVLDNFGIILHKVNKSKGLQNNTILSMHYSQYGKLWLGLDFGVDVLHFNTPISYINDYQGSIGTSYAAVLESEQLFLGTNQGLYTVPFSVLSNSYQSLDFQLIPNSQGQVWTLKKIQNKILCGHNKGLFEVRNNQFISVDSKPGVWTIVEMFGHVLTGNYNGIHIYSLQNQVITYLKSLPKVLGSFNQLEVYGNKLFAVLPNEGVLEFTLDKNFTVLDKKIYDKKDFGNVPFQIKIVGNQLQVHTLHSMYVKKIGTQQSLQKIHRDENPILSKHLLQDYFVPITLNSHYQLFSIYNGFALNNASIPKFIPYQNLPKPLIRRAIRFNNQNQQSILPNEDIPFSLNNVRINFLIPNSDSDTEYQYQLEGYDSDWSSWQHKTTAEYISLKEGTYTLKVRAKMHSKISEAQSYEFTINPPFYRSIYAYLLYFIGLGLLIYWLRKYSQQRLKNQRFALLKQQKESLNEQSRKYQEKLMQERQEKLELERQQLKKTIENKDLELAKKIIDQKEINDLVLSIKKKIEETQRQSQDKLSNAHFTELMHFVDKKMNKELNKEYEIAFDNSQNHFHTNLLKEHPNLSSKDLRICSYLLMNLTSKEMAKILQVLPSSIDVNRSRLRKKLLLEEDDNLRDYLNKFNLEN